MIQSIYDEEEYIAGHDLLRLLCRFDLDQARFFMYKYTKALSEYDRCEDCGEIQKECHCSDDAPIYDRYYKEYDDGDSYED